MDDIRVRFGKAVRRLRTDRGISQEQFAAEAKLARSYMGQVERGEVNISLDNIQKIAAAFGLDVGQLFAETDPRASGQ